MRRLIVLLFWATWSTTAAAQVDQSQLKEIAAYAQQVNEISVQFGVLVDRTTEYDDLVYGVTEGRVAPEDAGPQGRALSAELWAAHRQFSDRLAALPAPPASIRDQTIRARLDNIRDVAETSQEAARVFITWGEELLQSAISGDADVVDEIDKKNIKLIIAHLNRQDSAFDFELGYADKRQFSYFLTKTMKSSVLAITAILNGALDILETGEDGSFGVARSEAMFWISTGIDDIQKGRGVLAAGLQQLKAASMPGSAQQRLKQVLIELMESNVPQSFDVEERILQEISDFVEGFEALSDEELEAFMDKVTALETERAQLMIERQRRMASL